MASLSDGMGRKPPNTLFPTCWSDRMTDRPNTISGSIDQLPAQIAPAERRLTAAEFQRLADVPPEVEWFANIKNPSTKRAYENAIRDFIRFTGIARPEEFRTVALGMQSL